MNFANMTPTERMRASGLIGLIVIILFFVVHTMLGALAPKTPNAAAPPPDVAQTPGNPPQQNAAAETAPAPGAPKSPDEAFPIVPDKGVGPTDIKQSSTLDLTPEGDPFVPLRPTENKVAPAAGPKPDLQFTAARPAHFGGNPALPSPFGGNAPAGGMGGFQNNAPNPDPEIKVIGVVEGDQSIATIEVGGKARNVRPGESLARSYRLESVYGDGVRVRHEKQTYAIRVGNAINENNRTKQQ